MSISFIKYTPKIKRVRESLEFKFSCIPTIRLFCSTQRYAVLYNNRVFAIIITPPFPQKIRFSHHGKQRWSWSRVSTISELLFLRWSGRKTAISQRELLSKLNNHKEDDNIRNQNNVSVWSYRKTFLSADCCFIEVAL